MNKKKTVAMIAAGGIAGYYAVKAFKKKTGTGYTAADKVVLITGGSRGLGLIMARQLLQEGAKVAICARDHEELQTAVMDLERMDRQVLGIPCDIRDKDQVKAMIRQVRDLWGPIDILINNAGVIQVGPVETMKEEDFESCMNVHFWGSLYCILETAPDMIKYGKGRIVNISSIGGKISVPHLLPYSASKFALTGLSEGLHAELKKYGVKVTTICPGLMQTGSPYNAEFKGNNRQEYTWFMLSDSLPGLSENAEKAASKIISAMKNGDAELILSLPAKLAAAINGLFPGFTAEALSMVNKLLPAPNGLGEKTAKGIESRTKLSESFMTKSSQEAAIRNNEV